MVDGMIGFVIRVPHSPRANAKAVWSLAVSWSARTGRTNGLFESLSDEDVQEIEKYVSGRAQQRQHPLFIPTMLLDFLITFYVEHRRRLVSTSFHTKHLLVRRRILTPASRVSVSVLDVNLCPS